MAVSMRLQVAEGLQLGLQGKLSPEDEEMILLDGRTMMAQLRGEGRMAEAAAVQDMLLAMDDLRAERGVSEAPAAIDVVVPAGEDPLSEVRHAHCSTRIHPNRNADPNSEVVDTLEAALMGELPPEQEKMAVEEAVRLVHELRIEGRDHEAEALVEMLGAMGITEQPPPEAIEPAGAEKKPEEQGSEEKSPKKAIEAGEKQDDAPKNTTIFVPNTQQGGDMMDRVLEMVAEVQLKSEHAAKKQEERLKAAMDAKAAETFSKVMSAVDEKIAAAEERITSKMLSAHQSLKDVLGDQVRGGVGQASSELHKRMSELSMRLDTIEDSISQGGTAGNGQPASPGERTSALFGAVEKRLDGLQSQIADTATGGVQQSDRISQIESALEAIQFSKTERSGSESSTSPATKDEIGQLKSETVRIKTKMAQQEKRFGEVFCEPNS